MNEFPNQSFPLGWVNVSDLNSNYILNGLKPYTTYKYNVACYNATLIGYFADTSFNFTTGSSIPTAPKNVNCISKTNTSIELAWKKPDFLNGKLRQYNVEYSSDLTGEPYYKQLKNETLLKIELTKLKSNTTYMIYVIVETDAGSNKSKPLNITTAVGYPSEIVKIENKTSNIIQWKAQWEPSGLADIYELKTAAGDFVYLYGTICTLIEPICNTGSARHSVTIRAANIIWTNITADSLANDFQSKPQNLKQICHEQNDTILDIVNDSNVIKYWSNSTKIYVNCEQSSANSWIIFFSFIGIIGLIGIGNALYRAKKRWEEMNEIGAIVPIELMR